MKNDMHAKKDDDGAGDMREDEARTKEPAEENGKSPERKAGGRNAAKIAISLIIVVAVIGGLYFFLMPPQPAKNPYQLKFANETMNFRANLEKAAAVPVIPDDASVRSAILSGNVSKISLSYIPDEEYNGFYAADSFEIAYKLVIILKHYYGVSGYLYEGESGGNCMFFEEANKNICISHEPVSSESDITSSGSEPAIFMSASNETSVSVRGNMIYIKGKPDYDYEKKYTGLDLAADRFLLALMKV